MKIIDKPQVKFIGSENYNLMFNKRNGFTMRWGKTRESDPQYCPYGPEILDLEISSASEDDWNNMSELQIVTNHGCHGVGCQQMCYKAQNKEVYYEIELDNGKIIEFSEKEAKKIAIGDEIRV